MKKIRTRIILLSCLICIISIFFASFMSYTIVSDNIKVETFGRLDEVSKKHAKQIENWFVVQQKLLKELHNELNYNLYYNNYEELVPYLKYKNASNPDVIEYYVAFPNNTFITANGYWVPGDDYEIENREWYKRAKETNDVYLSSPYIDSNHGSLIVTLSVPIYSEGSFIGVLGSDIFIERIVGVLDEYRNMQDAYVFIVDNLGNILAHPNSEYLYSSNGELLEAGSIYGDYYENVKFGDLDLKLFKDFDGTERFVSYADMGTTGWKIGLAIEKDAVMAPLERIIRNTALLTLVLMAISIIFTFFLGTNIAQPINEAKKLIDRMALKDISENPDKAYYIRDDEIGRMFLSIQQIIESLRKFLTDIGSISDRVSTFSAELSDLTERTSYDAESLYDRATTISEAKKIRTDKIKKLAFEVDTLISSFESYDKHQNDSVITEAKIVLNFIRREIDYILELGSFEVVETESMHSVIQKQRDVMEKISSSSQCLDELVKELDEYIRTFRK